MNHSVNTDGSAPAGGGAIGSLVTGAGRGLGLAITRRLARRGDRVILTDWSPDLVASAAAELAAEGLDVDTDVLDVSDVESVDAVVARWDARVGLGTVVNNAGVAFAAPLAETDPADWDRLMGINLRGPFLVMRAAAPLLVARGGGSIVNVASTSSFTASSSPMLAYDVSKAGVKMMTMSAARELGATGVRVNAVAPGTMDTQLVRDLLPGGSAESSLADRIPMGRLGTTDEIAGAVEWLSSAAASYVTGHVLVVDGGWLT